MKEKKKLKKLGLLKAQAAALFSEKNKFLKVEPYLKNNKNFKYYLL